jgi:outer membrane protein assembly factor BamD (BamD/ComL family)
MKVAILVCVMAGTALAGPADRKRVETLEKEAHDSHDSEKYVAAGTAYMELYNAAPEAPDGDELLYNAGVMFEEGRAVSAAIQAYTLIGRQYPKGKIAAKALARLAKLYGDIAMYDKAADKLEEYAKKYAGEKDAYDALSDAIYFRKALGDREKAALDTNYFIKMFGTKKPHEAADAMFSLSALFEEDEERTLKSLREYVRTFGSKGGADKLVIAHAKIGQLLWKQSCPVRMVDGLCVTTRDIKRSCGTGSASVLTPRKRDETKLKDALGEFLAAAKALETSNIADPAARYYYAQAKLAEADLELEKFLALEFPRNLDLSSTAKTTREKSVKRFDAWLTEKTKTGATVNAKYEAVLAIRDAASSITAAQRVGSVSEAFATSIATGEIPRNVRGPDKTTAYCSALTNVAAPLENRAEVAYGVCLMKSTELSWFGESSRLCERALARTKPKEFPLLTELRTTSLQTAPVIALEPQPSF